MITTPTNRDITLDLSDLHICNHIIYIYMYIYVYIQHMPTSVAELYPQGHFMIVHVIPGKHTLSCTVQTCLCHVASDHLLALPTFDIWLNNLCPARHCCACLAHCVTGCALCVQLVSSLKRTAYPSIS